jgi:Gpi18-like mannosyltransferase
MGPWALLVALAIALRLALWPAWTPDQHLYLEPWIEQLRAGGGVAAIGQPISNYTPPYLYLLAAGSHLPLAPVTVVKGLALVIDAALAVAVGALAAALRPGGRTALAAATGALLLPSVVVNGALLGQCDALYTALLVVAVLLVVRERPGPACAVVGVAVAVKLQAVFVLPLLVVLVLNRRVPVRALPWAVVGWLAAMLPAVVAGRPVADLPRIYTGLVGHYDDLTLNAPNVYQWVRTPPGGGTGALAFAVVVLGAATLWLAHRRAGVDDDLVLRAAVLLLLLAPFTLPRMHERYTFPADVLAVAYAVVVRRGWTVAVASSTISALSYVPYARASPCRCSCSPRSSSH